MYPRIFCDCTEHSIRSFAKLYGAQYRTVLYVFEASRNCTVRYATEHSTLRWSQYCTAQYRTAQYSTRLYATVRGRKPPYDGGVRDGVNVRIWYAYQGESGNMLTMLFGAKRHEYKRCDCDGAARLVLK